jgi:class 3 adenylate cyclase
MPSEVLRASMVRRLFDILIGQARTEPAFDNVPSEWTGSTRLLDTWAQACSSDTSGPSVENCQEKDCPPLLLGLDWRSTDPLPESFAVPSFNLLCQIRRRFCNRAVLHSLQPCQLAAVIDVLSAWELARPLADVELLLKEIAPEAFQDSLMSRFLGPGAWKATLRTLGAPVSRHQDGIAWMMDVRCYSTLTEKLPPEALFDLLSPVFKVMNEELEAAGGMILEFIGDAIFVIFNAFDGPQASAGRVLAQTAKCLLRLHHLNALWTHAALPSLQIGVGIARGPVATGLLGGLRRCHLSTLGDTVNTAARVEGLTKNLPMPVAVEKSVFGPGGPSVWTEPEEVNYSLRDLGQHAMKNMARPASIIGLHALLRYWIDFVPMGFVATPEPGVVYIDTGNVAVPGIVDTHATGATAGSACELLNANPALVLDHLRGVARSEIEFRLHEQPDLDCAAGLYTAFEWLEGKPREAMLNALAGYVTRVDQGFVSPADRVGDSLYAIFVAHQHLTRVRRGRQVTNMDLLEAGLRTVDAACFLVERLMERTPSFDFSTVFAAEPGWFPRERLLLAQDSNEYSEDKARGRTCGGRVGGCSEPVVGLYLDHPRSLLFKMFARTDRAAPGAHGYGFLTVDWSDDKKRRFVISVDPASGTHLRGLGEALEAAESAKRNDMGQARPLHPKRYPADNSDPWYFGQGHGFTIVDSPARGTVLTAEEVEQVRMAWSPPD